ncbi:DHA2 family efflux MFS transporter permease subunit [Pseudonocardiaceae bacterium YIM PH 21723]|nr:DHA2 family efflux MFS transporter permease subunit [Pseudonocardiaceae bacterium YIM PH 21723]
MMDGFIINVALTRIGHELGSTIAGLQWIVDGYLLVMAALILVAGSLGDRYGRLRLFKIGIVWFTAASLLCGLAPNTATLVAARVLQGVGAALLTPASLAILQSGFRQRDRSRAIGAWSAITGLTSVIGPLVGGLLIQAWSWRLTFLINLPIGILCLWLARRHVPDHCDERTGGRPDITSTVLGALGLAGITAALVEQGTRGWTDPLILGCAIVGVLALTAFCLLQVRSHDPLVPPELFASHTFTVANALTFMVYAALGGMGFLMVQQLQVSLGYSPTAAGIASVPVAVLMFLLAERSGELAQRIGPRLQLIAGPLMVAAGMLLLRRVVPGATYLGSVLPGVLVFGIGLTLMVAPVTAVALAAAPDRHAGVASGVNNAVARTGSLLAVAVLPAAVGLSGTAYADPIALTSAWKLALLICAVAAGAGGVLAAGMDNNVLSARSDDATTPDGRR